ncbi:uncharacterized protein LOC126213158 isoform X3 [Schistocerca nitens]|uniref:uncharacterized protein LOC126213158 isoform X3 n=1 Tax=Schistocerca nitens TaxID=7011 RepID=UPI0021183DD9|nr:uncharacterized protein LOC126213158 isoform X3 [Schistocerca nitens]
MHSECRTFTTYISIVMIYKTVVLDNLKTISVKEEKTEEMCVEPGTMNIMLFNGTKYLHNMINEDIQTFYPYPVWQSVL